MIDKTIIDIENNQGKTIGIIKLKTLIGLEHITGLEKMCVGSMPKDYNSSIKNHFRLRLL